jgi:hypothetical protein
VQQSTLTVGLILFAFIIFTTMRGNLIKYFQVIGVAAPPPATIKSGGGGIGGDLGSIAQLAALAG